MESRSIYQDIAQRTDGDIYIGVVGPVRTGKSTFIKRFMESLVIPNIENSYKRERATDELPQSAAGRTIMTTEPKFIPNEAVEIRLKDNAVFRVRMIDCVGYIVPSALGYIENDNPRMVMTPWYDKEIPFNMAAEIGTRKVITDHSTIGLVVTTDGSIGEIPRDEYAEAEERVIEELKDINKPFVILLNSTQPTAASTLALRAEMENKYNVPVIPVNCLELGENEIRSIIETVLFEFPVKEIGVDLPDWIAALDMDHWLHSSLY
ncbi:MAG: stage IV sporulation protein A, partial [[Clostridium] cellulosi]